jgi:protein KRI1
LNRGWIDKSERSVNPPRYKDIVGEEDKASSVDEAEDMEALEESERFEKKYNFRFEELEATAGPGSSYSAVAVTTHARNIDGSVRRKDSRRSEQRKKKIDRKEEEKVQKMEELKRLKNLKKKEIWDKLKKVQEISGCKSEDKIAGLIEGVDLEGDFDPEKWDSKMTEVFDDEYYGDVDKLKKPNFGDDIDIGDLGVDLSDDDEAEPEAPSSSSSLKPKSKSNKRKAKEDPSSTDDDNNDNNDKTRPRKKVISSWTRTTSLAERNSSLSQSSPKRTRRTRRTRKKSPR